MASSGEERGVVVDIRSAAESAGDDGARDAPLHVVESLCMRCGENGTTRILLTLIPHFREVVLMAFECPHCSERNNEIQFAGQLQPKGCCYTLKVPKGQPEAVKLVSQYLSVGPKIFPKQDRSSITWDLILNRQVVKSDSATIKIPELDFEIPPEAQRGTLSTVEGSIMRAVSELQALQDERKKVDPQKAEAIEQFLVKLRSLGSGEAAFTFILDDASGNSFIENPNAPSSDPLLSLRFYERTYEQQAALGFLAEPTKESGDSSQDASTVEGNSGGPQRIPHGSVGAVAGRRAIAQGNSDEITAALCRYSAPEELKPGGEIPAKGKKTTLIVRNVKDLSRDVIKSDSAAVSVPELELELSSGTLGGIVTTVEGLIVKICEGMFATYMLMPPLFMGPKLTARTMLVLVKALERVHGFQLGDSTYEWKKKKWDGFTERLAKLLNLEEPWTLILDDALAASFIAPATDSLEDDKQLTIEEYERSWEQNEELGLNDMDTSSADMAYNTTSTS
ncbi:unnamed protein product [Triticum turgidum subsp. durum]|uniref:Zinc finger ZPR1-type domain-containing protein n=1 Tax=Triticum turgidum subsp. durum TaxID=4567 RepID=A0A9R1P9R7_TRITD|nr:unnamed protein product [Triticum turgidum subsp. durum]